MSDMKRLKLRRLNPQTNELALTDQEGNLIEGQSSLQIEALAGKPAKIVVTIFASAVDWDVDTPIERTGRAKVLR